MTITKKQNGTSLEIALEGRLDTVTSMEFDKELKDSLDNITSLTLDIANLEYITSAGLRVLLGLHKEMLRRGGLKIIHVNEPVKEIFEMTGFLANLNIE